MATPEAFMLWCLLDWSEGPQILAQFLFDSEKGCPESSEPKGCLKKNLKHDFRTRGQNLNVPIEEKKIWTTLESWNIKFGNIIFQKNFRLWPFHVIYGHFKTKICNISEKKRYQKKFYCAKKSYKKFLQQFRWSKKFLIFFAFSFFCNTLYILNFFWPLLSLLLHTFWVTSQSDHKSGP